MKKLSFLALLILVFPIWGQGGNFPVQIIPQVTPPPPIYFSDYADASTINSPLRVQIILNDFTITNREVRLKTYFEGNGIQFQSNDIVTGAVPLFLEGGTPLVLTNADLAPYFKFENINGIPPNLYGKAIPEGSYQFCYEIIDVLTGSRLSGKSCATTVIFQNQPPFLVLPRNKTNINEVNPQNIVFQWTPRHINVSNVVYELSLVEIWDNQIDPQAAFLSSPPVFQTTTTSTTYVYGPADPLLLSGRNYAWRIQAKAKQGVEEIGLFKNQGYSEIFSFSYAGSCDLPVGISHEVKGSTNANIFWDDFSTEIPEFTVRYRKKGGNNEWFQSKTTTNQITLWNLKGGTTYEYQVQKKCVVTKSDWSFAKELTTALEFEEESIIDCGIAPAIDLENKEPLPSIQKGDTFKAGDFPIKIVEVSGSNGRFTGKGYSRLPYLKNIKVAVEFTNILINIDKELVEGAVQTVYDSTWKNKGLLDIDKTLDVAEDVLDEFTGGDKNEPLAVPFEIPSEDNINVEDGKITITGQNGEKKTFDYDEGDSYEITDKNNDTYHVDEDGTITEGGKGAQGGEATAENTTGVFGGSGTVAEPSVKDITAADITVTFTTSDKTKYDLDVVTTDFEKANYPKVTMPTGGYFYPPHKAIVEGKTDEFLAIIDNKNPEINLDNIVVKTVKGTQIKNTRNGNTFTLTVTGVNSYHNQEALITYKSEDGNYKTIASFFIHHIKEQNPVEVVVIPVNGASTLNNLQQELNGIFNKAGATFTVKRGNALTLTQSDWDTNNNGILDYETNGLLSNAKNYPPELKKIHKKYKEENPSYNAKAYHLFLLPNSIKANKNLNGFMPKTRQWGYLFNAYTTGDNIIGKKDDKNLIAAHELGHGVFRLEHPFEDDENANGSGTNWLMDYTGGKKLSYTDWAVMNNEGLNIGLFQDREDGQHSSYEYLVGFNVVPGLFTKNILDFKDSHISFVSPTGKIISLPKNVKDVTFINKGALFGFTINEDGKEERYVGASRKAGTSEENFAGYLKAFSNQTSAKWEDRVYKDLVSKTLPKQTTVYLGKLNASPCGINLYSKIYPNKVKDSWNSGGDKEPINNTDYTTGLTAVNSKIIESPSVCNSCKKGKQFFENHAYLIKNNSQSDKEALEEITKLICSTDNPIDYEVLVSQINKDNWEKNKSFWNGHERYLFNAAAEMFWKRADALPLYLEALKKVNVNIKTFNSKLNIESSKEDYYSALYYLNDDFLKTLSLQDKQELLKLIFNHNFFITTSYFNQGKSDVSLIKKLVSSIDNNNIDLFLADLAEKEEYKAVANSKREMLFEVIDVIDFSILQEANIDVKIEALSRMLDGNLLRLFNTNYENVIAKLIKSVENSDAAIFLNELENTKKGVNNKPLVYHLKERLGNFFSNDAYTDFFKEINRLVAARVEIEPNTYGIVGDLSWDVEQKDYVLVSFVRNRNNYAYNYNNSTHKVNVTTCTKKRSRNSKCANTIDLIPKDSSPFDMVMIYFLKNVTPFSPLPTNAIYNDRGAIEGNGYAVPVLFLEHLYSDISEQRLKNAAWNTFNVALTIATVGEGTAAISAVRVAATSSRLAANAGKNILLRTIGKQAFPLLELTYTVGSTGYQFGTGEKLPPEWETINLFFTAKGTYDLIDGGLKGLAKLSKAAPDVKTKVISELDIRGPTGKQITLDELDDLVYNTKRAVDNSQNEQLIKAWKEANASALGTGKLNLLNKLTKVKYNKFKNFIDDLADESTALYRLNLLDDTDLLKLADDFDGFSDVLKIKFKQPDYIDGWLAISKRAEMRLDEEILDAMFKLTTNHKSFVRTYPTELDNIFKRLGEARAGCKECDSSKEIDLQVGNVKDIVNDLEATISKVGDDAEGMQKFLKEMGESSKKAKGGTFTLKTLNGKWAELTEGGYTFTRFEGSIPDIETGHKLDLLFRNATKNRTRSIELKNWKTVKTIKADETSQFYQYVKSKKEFRYYFNDNVAEAKKAFQNIFKDAKKAKELWKLNPELFKSLNNKAIKNLDELIDLAKEEELINYINWVF